MAKVGAIAHLLQHDLPEDGTERQQTLLERALVYAAETEQRMADQTDRIAQLENLSFHDPLTGLLNRRGFLNHMAKVLARARRYGEVGLVVYCDLDDFKRVNDKYGHAVGDELLRNTAKTLNSGVREIDLVGRLGGDEFAAVLVDANWKDGSKRVSTLQWMLEEIGVTHHGQKITAHASLGAEPYGAHDNALDLIRRADMAMYYNKRRRHIGLMQSAAE
jgi:diguanylate cyclase (GGDEF)-like protein